MQDFAGKVAVVTGAAGGIGRALAERCAREGMRVVLADIDRPALLQAQEELAAGGAPVLGVETDVSKLADVEALAQKTLQAFGAVHLLFNNAGVGAGGSVMVAAIADWEWVLGVNLWGVIYGQHVFLPIMLAQEAECHIVNTSSAAAFALSHPIAPYAVSKQAVLALSEVMYHSLKEQGARVGVSVLLPGLIKTNMADMERNRPAALRTSPDGRPTVSWDGAVPGWRERMAHATPPAEVADQAFAGIREGRLYILTHPEFKERVRARADAILGQVGG